MVEFQHLEIWGLRGRETAEIEGKAYACKGGGRGK